MPLNIQLRDDATLDNFLFSDRLAALRRALETQLAPGGEPIVFLHGPRGSGKSHLLQACCHAAGQRALYLPLGELAGYPPEALLAGVESLALVCIDDLELLQPLADEERRAWEQALFHCFNRAREAGCRLLVASQSPPRGLALGLEDLRSRLAWGLVYRLPALDDGQKRAVLQFRAARRGLRMTAEVARYLVARAPREPRQLLDLLDELDRRALAEQRGLTVPFVKRVLGW